MNDLDWFTVFEQFLREHPDCRVCGARSQAITVHIDPEHEEFSWVPICHRCKMEGGGRHRKQHPRETKGRQW